MRAVLATKHAKEPLIAPPLAAIAGLLVETAVVETDALGTFTGEVARPGDARTTAIAKARLGMRATGALRGLASEGTIIPDPAVPLLVVDHELVVLVDDEHDVVIVGEATSDELHMFHQIVTAGVDPRTLLTRADVPPHHLTVRPRQGVGAITKGIATLEALRAAIHDAASADPEGQAVVETDLRAHLCPSRRPAIERAAADLARRLMSRCPRCACPGYGVARSLGGLPCETCGSEVPVPAAMEWRCPSCGHHELRYTEKLVADRATCPVCNP